MRGLIIRRYPAEHYSTVFNPHSGFFARIEDTGYPEPFWASAGPELIDVSITNWCDKGCVFCYRESSTVGKHLSVGDYEIIMKQAKKMGVLQVALGGGNPNQHPDFAKILCNTREKYGIVPSFTTNGRGLSKDVLSASKRYCGCVAVSAYAPYPDLERYVSTLIEFDIKTNIHFLLDGDSIQIALRWLDNWPRFLVGVNAVVFLSRKPVGRSVSSSPLLRDSPLVSSFFEQATSSRTPLKIGFDSCLVTGLAKYSSASACFYDACEAARFSMFISEDMKMYPCSFMVHGWQGVPVAQDNILEIWRTHPAFVLVRSRLLNNRCNGCLRFGNCRGGCPMFDEINLCSPSARRCV